MVALIVKKHVLPMFKSKSNTKLETGINNTKNSVFGELKHIDKLGDQLHDIQSKYEQMQIDIENEVYEKETAQEELR